MRMVTVDTMSISGRRMTATPKVATTVLGVSSIPRLASSRHDPFREEDRELLTWFLSPRLFCPAAEAEQQTQDSERLNRASAGATFGN
mmetsp:Transcript_21161/g.50246  ORF Transcript_21161/g.50246 Transcript_21161/m.50246 type:complete len:88 (+) Transcript_21161:391-654(+)